MKKLILIFNLIFVFCSFAVAESFSLDVLKEQTRKVVSVNAGIVSESQDDASASVAYSEGDSHFQFTLSSDLESQMPSEEKIMIADRKAQFFRPMGEESGGLFIPLKNNKGSLVIIVMQGMFSDNVLTSKDLKEISEKMDLSVFD